MFSMIIYYGNEHMRIYTLSFYDFAYAFKGTGKSHHEGRSCLLLDAERAFMLNHLRSQESHKKGPVRLPRPKHESSTKLSDREVRRPSQSKKINTLTVSKNFGTMTNVLCKSSMEFQGSTPVFS